MSNVQDTEIRKTFFRYREALTQRQRLTRLLHPERMSWKGGEVPTHSEATLVRIEAMDEMGLGEGFLERMEGIETESRKHLEGLAGEHPLGRHFEELKGLGMFLCGAFVAAGGDIERAATVTKFWAGMGLDIVIIEKDGIQMGVAPRRIRPDAPIGKELRQALGDRHLPALPFVTTVGEMIRQQMVKAQGKLAERYYAYKEASPTDWNKMHRHKHALWLTQKLLYACLWREWRLGRGLEAPDPYAFALLKHDGGHLVRIADLYG